jgi:hypothetical protein
MIDSRRSRQSTMRRTCSTSSSPSHLLRRLSDVEWIDLRQDSSPISCHSQLEVIWSTFYAIFLFAFITTRSFEYSRSLGKSCSMQIIHTEEFKTLTNMPVEDLSSCQTLNGTAVMILILLTHDHSYQLLPKKSRSRAKLNEAINEATIAYQPSHATCN